MVPLIKSFLDLIDRSILSWEAELEKNNIHLRDNYLGIMNDYHVAG